VLKPHHTPAQDPAAVTALRNLKDKVQSEIQKYRGRADLRPQRQPHSNDFARLARRICGKSIGLVLGGGGARGLSQLVSGPEYKRNSWLNMETGPFTSLRRIRSAN